MLMLMLRQMAKAFGGVPAVAGRACLNPTQLYRTLSRDGNPTLGTFLALLKTMGMRLSVQVIGDSPSSRAADADGEFQPGA